jgi:hypothetical protein
VASRITSEPFLELWNNMISATEQFVDHLKLKKPSVKKCKYPAALFSSYCALLNQQLDFKERKILTLVQRYYE